MKYRAGSLYPQQRWRGVRLVGLGKRVPHHSGALTSKAANDKSRLASDLVHWGSEIDWLIDSDDSSDDEVDYAQQEIQNESRASSESENEPELGREDTNHRKNKPRKRPDMAWEGMETNVTERHGIFTILDNVEVGPLHKWRDVYLACHVHANEHRL
ncbi:hypothetical protein J6590_028883 [Homalodisca vitripennis]|nr:hypothetical protein J6590_028883 [Homalodisca vitripennis]